MNEKQIYHEIQWLMNKVDEVKEQMKKRPSKWRHLKDLERQIRERQLLLGTTI